MQTDFLVIGSGIAGLTYALKVAQKCPDKIVTILTKTVSDETKPASHAGFSLFFLSTSKYEF